MSLFDRLYRWITKGRSPATEHVALPKRVAELERAYGSRRAAARAAGIPESTLRSWTKGTEPKGAAGARNLDRLEKAQRRVRLAPGREARLRQAFPKQIMVKATVVVSDDEREREFDLGPWLEQSSRDMLIDAYLRGGEEELERAFMLALEDYIPDAEYVDAEITKMK